MNTRRKILTIDELRELTHRMGQARGNNDGDCMTVRITPTPLADGVTGDLGENWTVMVIRECADFWGAILQDIARTYDVDFGDRA